MRELEVKLGFYKETLTRLENVLEAHNKQIRDTETNLWKKEAESALFASAGLTEEANKAAEFIHDLNNSLNELRKVSFSRQANLIKHCKLFIQNIEREIEEEQSESA